MGKSILFVLATILSTGCAQGWTDLEEPRDPRSSGPVSSPAEDGGWIVRIVDGSTTDAGATTSPTPSTADAGPPAGPAPTPGVSVPPFPACARTYDQQTAYWVRSPGTAYVPLLHRDDTTLPADEGSTPCSPHTGCTETVTRLADGEWIEGVLWGIDTFTFQAAWSSADGVGSIRFEACGAVVSDTDMHLSSGTLPGFTNSDPAFALPAGATCVARLTAHGGYVDVRAVTTTCSTPPPVLPNQP